jgi:carbamate kinase
MIGYLLLQAFENACPGREVAAVLTQTLVSADDPAFEVPTKLIGPSYSAAEADALATRWGWQLGPDGEGARRVVASPEPVRIVELATIAALLERGVIVICAGGGGIPVVKGTDGSLRGIEAVIDKDLVASLTAEQLGADALVLLTDVAAVYDDFGTTSAHPLRTVTPSMLRSRAFPAGSMGPKVEAACRFVEATGRRAMIGHLTEAAGLLAERCGTLIEPDGA